MIIKRNWRQLRYQEQHNCVYRKAESNTQLRECEKSEQVRQHFLYTGPEDEMGRKKGL